MNGQTSPPGRKQAGVSSLEEVITFRISRLMAIMERAGGHWSERRFDLSINQWHLLALVQSRGDALAGKISELLLMDTSRLIKSLIARKLIRSKPDKHDARAVALSLTAKGQMILEEIIAEVLRSNERMLAPLQATEVAALGEMLDRLIGYNKDLLKTRSENQT